MRSRLAVFLILLIFAATPGTHPQDIKPQRAKLSPAGERWVENTLKHMTTDEKVGQVIFPTYFGGFYSTESPDYQTLVRHVENDHAGGFILATRGGPRPHPFEAWRRAGGQIDDDYRALLSGAYGQPIGPNGDPDPTDRELRTAP